VASSRVMFAPTIAAPTALKSPPRVVFQLTITDFMMVDGDGLEDAVVPQCDHQQKNPGDDGDDPEVPILNHFSSRMMILASRATSSQALAACAAASASAGVRLVVSQEARSAMTGIKMNFFMVLRDLMEWSTLDRS